jgi:hypothetical protein
MLRGSTSTAHLVQGFLRAGKTTFAKSAADGKPSARAALASTAARSAVAIRAMTLSQSPRAGWRNSRMVGTRAYRRDRAASANRERTATASRSDGRARQRGAQRWYLSTVMTRSSCEISAAASAKLSSDGPRLRRPLRAFSAAWSLARTSLCRPTKVAGTSNSGASAANAIDRSIGIPLVLRITRPSQADSGSMVRRELRLPVPRLRRDAQIGRRGRNPPHSRA